MGPTRRCSTVANLRRRHFTQPSTLPALLGIGRAFFYPFREAGGAFKIVARVFKAPTVVSSVAATVHPSFSPVFPHLRNLSPSFRILWAAPSALGPRRNDTVPGPVGAGRPALSDGRSGTNSHPLRT